MNNLIKLIQKNVSNRSPKQNLYFKLRKIKVLFGKTLLLYAALPLMSFWAVVPGMMLVGIKPSVWAKSKLIDYKLKRRLR